MIFKFSQEKKHCDSLQNITHTSALSHWNKILKMYWINKTKQVMFFSFQ